MSQILASLFLVVSTFLVGLANYWFTFGLWPKSWLSFTLCLFANVLLTGLLQAVSKERR